MFGTVQFHSEPTAGFAGGVGAAHVAAREVERGGVRKGRGAEALFHI